MTALKAIGQGAADGFEDLGALFSIDHFHGV